jgi:molybdopterin/thiamine biosynthesis adenylyltransferase
MSAVLESDCLDFLLKDSRSKAAAVASGSWFHNRIVDGKKDSLCTVVLLYGTIYTLFLIVHIVSPLRKHGCFKLSVKMLLLQPCTLMEEEEWTI